MNKLTLSSIFLFVACLLLFGCTSSSTKTHDGGFYSMEYPSSWTPKLVGEGDGAFYNFVQDTPYTSLIVQALAYSDDFNEMGEYEAFEKSIIDPSETIVSTRTTSFKGVDSLEMTSTHEDSGTIKTTVLYIPRKDYIAVVSYEYLQSEESQALPPIKKALESISFK